MIKVQNLHKSYASKSGEALQILTDINLEITKGEIVSIVGSSGSGKSTLLHLLGGLTKPDKGDIWINTTKINDLKTDDLALFRNKELGFVFQFHHLLAEFTAIENIAMPLIISGMSIKDAKEKAMILLQKIGIENRHDHRPSELSGGEQQRVAIARALINNPHVILADEPTGNLDQKNSEIILDLFFALREEIQTTMILVTHDKSIAEKCEKKLVLTNGSLSLS